MLYQMQVTKGLSYSTYHLSLISCNMCSDRLDLFPNESVDCAFNSSSEPMIRENRQLVTDEPVEFEK
jgi:hypothetical protein